MNYKSYENYMDSNIEWIGKIPAHWKITPLKRFTKLHNGKEINVEVEKDDKNSIGVYGSGGLFKYTNEYLFNGESVLFGRKGTLGKPIYLNKRFWTVDTMYYLSFNMHLLPKYCYYYLTVYPWNKISTETAKPSVVGNDLIISLFAIPDMDEQKQIANYLDKKTSKIDTNIAKNKELINLLEEKRTALINQVVTKGLNPEVPLKDSGIEWIGEIPEHWELKKFRHVLKERNEKNNPIKSKERLSLSIDKGVTLYAEKTTNLDRFKDDFTQYKLAYKGDLVLNSMNMIVGAVGVSNYFGCVSPVYYTYYDEIDDNICANYCDYLFKTKTIKKFLRSLGNGIMSIDRGDDRINTCRLKISRDDLRNMYIPYPPLKEQGNIIRELDFECDKIKKTTNVINKHIELLEEYKTSLIHHVVTGKIDVRGEKL